MYKIRRRRRFAILSALIALVVPAGAVVTAPSTAGAAGPRPGFQLPFPCGQKWRLDSWAHAPALDMVREPDQTGTEGAVLVAPAAGVVEQSFYHSNAGNMIQIDHGGDWFTTYIHLQSRQVSVGQRVTQGQMIGRVGHTGPTSNGHPHLHFELAIDTNGDGRASWGTAGSERVRPWFNGVEYGQANGRTWRNVTSHNCGARGVRTFYLSSTGSSLTYGNTGDIPLTGDFNADGRDEPAVYRPATRTFYFSTTGTSLTYGNTGDTPLTGDFNADGRDEPAVYRP